MIQGLPGCIPWGVITVYLNDYLLQQRSMQAEQATLVMGAFGVGNSMGQVFGAKEGQRLYNKEARFQPMLMAATTLLGTIPGLGLLQYSGGNVLVYITLAITTGILAAVTGPNIRAVLMNVTIPSNRGMAFGMFNLFDDLGRGLGPALVASLVGIMGRTKAFSVGMTLWVVCGLLLQVMVFTVTKDETRAQADLQAYAMVSTGTKTTLDAAEDDVLMEHEN
ncbi:unnamed protein product [Choristocarpus tenellus]